VFPLIDIKYYPNTKQHLTIKDYPMVSRRPSSLSLHLSHTNTSPHPHTYLH